MKSLLTLLFFMFISTVATVAQKTVQNDSNTPLHLLQPEYKTPYGIASDEDIGKSIERVFQYIQANTPACMVDSKTNKVITDYKNLPPEAQLERGHFRIASYEWGVTYSALQIAAEATGDNRYSDYVKERFDFLSQIFMPAKQAYYDNGAIDRQMLQFTEPKALDDAGAMCAAMIKVQMKERNLKYKPLIDNYFNYIMYREYRLSDGTLARNRPHQNTVWTDDMYMGIPAIAQMGRYASDNNNKFFSEAVKQVKLFSEKMFVPEKRLFRHGWVESSGEHPSFFWGRANGWAMLAMCDVLDALPANYQGREDILNILRSHIQGVVS
jgi:rhamnogalacturonyl hydrolase YesR